MIEFYKGLTKEQQKKINKLYFGWVIKQDCAITGVDNKFCGYPHHLRLSNNAGTSIKPPHIYMIPMKNDIHTDCENMTIPEAEKKWSAEMGVEINFENILTGLHDLFSRLYDLQKIVEGEE